MIKIVNWQKKWKRLIFLGNYREKMFLKNFAGWDSEANNISVYHSILKHEKNLKHLSNLDFSPKPRKAVPLLKCSQDCIKVLHINFNQNFSSFWEVQLDVFLSGLSIKLINCYQLVILLPSYKRRLSGPH